MSQALPKTERWAFTEVTFHPLDSFMLRDAMHLLLVEFPFKEYTLLFCENHKDQGRLRDMRDLHILTAMREIGMEDCVAGWAVMQNTLEAWLNSELTICARLICFRYAEHGDMDEDPLHYLSQ